MASFGTSAPPDLGATPLKRLRNCIGNRLAGFLLWLDRADTHWPSRPHLRLGALAGPASTLKSGAALINIVLVVAAAWFGAQVAMHQQPVTGKPGLFKLIDNPRPCASC